MDIFYTHTHTLQTHRPRNNNIVQAVKVYDWLIFAVFGQSVRLRITAFVSIQRRVVGHSTVTVAEGIVTGVAGPFNGQMRKDRPL